MSISQSVLPEFDHEMANTRKSLERVPLEKSGWKPHEKSMAMGRLATHIMEIPGWTAITLEKDSLDVNPPGGSGYQPAVIKSRQELLDMFDKNIASARAAIAAANDAQWMKSWTFLAGGKEIFTLPKIAVLRSFVLSHMIHHRAQLGVYLRLNDIAVPSIYGPSADEGSF